MSDHSEFVNTHKTRGMANVESSTRCTLRCPQCARRNLLAPKNSKDYTEIKQRIAMGSDLLINDAEKLLKFFEQGLLLCGSISDPVFWPQILDFLRLIQKYPDREVFIHTAATQKNIEWYRNAFNLSGKNVTWRIGLDGMSDTSMIYRIGQDSQLLFDVMLLGKEMGINIEWHFIVFNYNVHQIEQAREFARQHQIDLFLIKTDRPNPGAAVPIEWQPTRNKEVLKT